MFANKSHIHVHETQGIYPNELHILDVELISDCVASTLLDLTDSDTFWVGTSRNKRLQLAFANYRDWYVAAGRSLSRKRCFGLIGWLHYYGPSNSWTCSLQGSTLAGKSILINWLANKAFHVILAHPASCFPKKASHMAITKGSANSTWMLLLLDSWSFGSPASPTTWPLRATGGQTKRIWA